MIMNGGKDLKGGSHNLFNFTFPSPEEGEKSQKTPVMIIGNLAKV
jgi:hypothetical protein